MDDRYLEPQRRALFRHMAEQNYKGAHNNRTNGFDKFSLVVTLFRVAMFRTTQTDDGRLVIEFETSTGPIRVIEQYPPGDGPLAFVVEYQANAGAEEFLGDLAFSVIDSMAKVEQLVDIMARDYGLGS